MEKLQPIIAGVKKYHFWILCVALLGVVLYGWWVASDELPVSFRQNALKVKAQFAQAANVATRQPAGPTWPDLTQKKGSDLKNELASVVDNLRTHQRPDKLWSERFSRIFRGSAERLGRTSAWPPELLAEYKKVAPGEVDKLRELVGAATSDESGGVQWDPESFKQFHKQYEWFVSPTNAMVFEAQEKLWIAQAVLRSISEVNKWPTKAGGVSTTDKFNLPISFIEKLEVGGNEARDKDNETIDTNLADLAGPGAAPADNGPHPGGPEAAAVPERGQGPGGAAAPHPVAAGVPPGAAKSGTRPSRSPAGGKKSSPAPGKQSPAPSPGNKVKGIPGLRSYPVRVRVKMDLNSLSRLLVVLSNQHLMLTIEYVHIENQVTLLPAEAPPPVAGPMDRQGNMPPGGGPAGPGMRGGPGMPGGPGVATAGPRAGQPLGPGMTAGPGGPEGAPAPEAGPPLLVQLPRGAVVDIEATAYVADPAEVESLKIAIREREGLLR